MQAHDLTESDILVRGIFQKVCNLRLGRDMAVSTQTVQKFREVGAERRYGDPAAEMTFSIRTGKEKIAQCLGTPVGKIPVQTDISLRRGAGHDTDTVHDPIGIEKKAVKFLE